MKRKACLAGIALGLLALVLGWPPASSASRLASGSNHRTSPDQAGASSSPIDVQLTPQKAYLPFITSNGPSGAPTPGTINPPMTGYNIGCRTSGATQVCASVCSKYPPPNSTLNVYGRLYVNGVAQKDRTMTARFDLPGGPVTCTSGMDYTGLALCGQNIGAVPRYAQITVHVTIGGLTADTYFTPQ
jgi:hypothetical protein